MGKTMVGMVMVVVMFVGVCMSERAHNFGAGPAALPEAVLQRAQKEMLDFEGSGMSVLEWTNLDQYSGTHPGVPAENHKVQEMMLGTEQKLRATLDIPEDYHVMFMHGGAVGQFSAVPLNLLGGDNNKADFVVSGFWSQRAMNEASKYGDVKEVATYDGQSGGPDWNAWAQAARKDSTYLFITLSETVQGIELFQDPPASYNGPPVVVDATSTILSRPLDIASYGIVFASGGKNVPAGMAVIIARKSLLESTKKQSVTPSIMDYRINAGYIGSIFESKPNTPTIFPVYLLGLVLDYIKEEEGGLAAVSARLDKRVGEIYGVADTFPNFYRNTVHPEARSRMNAVFMLPSRELEKEFVKQADARGLLHLYGHPVSGGIRVTMYNWIRDESVSKVITFMNEFAAQFANKEDL